MPAEWRERGWKYAVIDLVAASIFAVAAMMIDAPAPHTILAISAVLNLVFGSLHLALLYISHRHHW
jgi:hypothetical protein